MTDVRDVPRRSTRAVLVLGILAGLNSGVVLATSQPEQLSLATDVYYHAAEAVLAGEDLYAATPPDLPGYHYIYPPVVVLAFLPYGLLGSETAAFAIQTVLNVAAAIGVGVVVLRALERRGVALGRPDRLLVVGFTLLSAWSAAQLVMGQVNLWLALGMALGLDWLDQRRDASGGEGDRDATRDGHGRSRETAAGVAFALVALVKLFPATIGLWLLRTRRDRAVVAAVATGLGGLVLGALVFGPDLTSQYLTDVLVERFRGETFEGTPDPGRNHTTVRRMLAGAVGGSSPLVTPLALALVVPPVAYCYRDVSTDSRRLTAILATLVGTLLVMPLQPLYFSLLYFPAVLLLFTLDAGGPRKLLIVGVLLTSTFVGPQTIEWVAGPLPASLGASMIDWGNALLTVILPSTVGMWLLLAACLTVHVRVGDPNDGSEHEDPEQEGPENPDPTAST